MIVSYEEGWVQDLLRLADALRSCVFHIHPSVPLRTNTIHKYKTLVGEIVGADDAGRIMKVSASVEVASPGDNKNDTSHSSVFNLILTSTV